MFKKMVFLVVSFFVLFCSTKVFAGGHFVGNGGEGILVGDKLYLRDLYEANAHLNPWIGEKASNDLRTRLNNKSLQEAVQSFEPLLIRKLTDLNDLSPSLGFYVLASLQSFDLVFLEESLGKLPDDTPVVDIPEDRRVQIANRLLYTIRISKSAWVKLDDANKVALLIHEGFYALSTAECGPLKLPPSCWQSPMAAKEFTGKVFLKTTGKFSSDLDGYFNIPRTSLVCEAVEKFSIDIFPGFKPDGNMRPKTQTFSAKNASSPEDRASLIQEACLALAKDSGWFTSQLMVHLYRLPYDVQTWDYQQFVDGNTRAGKIAVSIRERSPGLTLFVSQDADCETQLNKVSEDWFSGRAEGRDESRQSACQN